MKTIVPSIITGVLLIVFGILWTFFLLVALNGFSESDSTRALIVYGVWTLFMVILFGAGSGFAARFIARKLENVKFWLIALGMIVACFLLGSIAIVLGMLPAVIAAGA